MDSRGHDTEGSEGTSPSSFYLMPCTGQLQNLRRAIEKPISILLEVISYHPCLGTKLLHAFATLSYKCCAHIVGCRSRWQNRNTPSLLSHYTKFLHTGTLTLGLILLRKACKGSRPIGQFVLPPRFRPRSTWPMLLQFSTWV